MLNFVHRPCCAEGDQAEVIGGILREKCLKVNNNPLEILVGKIKNQKIRFGTKKITKYKFKRFTRFSSINGE